MIAVVNGYGEKVSHQGPVGLLIAMEDLASSVRVATVGRLLPEYR